MRGGLPGPARVLLTWRRAHLLEAHEIGGSEPRIDVALLLSDDSLPYALYALGDSSFTHALFLKPEPHAVTMATASTVAVEARGLSSGRHTFSFCGRAATVSSSLDRVVNDALGRAEAATVSIGAAALGWLVALPVPGGTSWWIVLPVAAGIFAPVSAVTRAAHAASPRGARPLGTRRRRVVVGALVLLNALVWATALGADHPPAAVVVLAPVAASLLISLALVRVVPVFARAWRRTQQRRRGKSSGPTLS